MEQRENSVKLKEKLKLQRDSKFHTTDTNGEEQVSREWFSLTDSSMWL